MVFYTGVAYGGGMQEAFVAIVRYAVLLALSIESIAFLISKKPIHQQTRSTKYIITNISKTNLLNGWGIG